MQKPHERHLYGGYRRYTLNVHYYYYYTTNNYSLYQIHRTTYHDNSTMTWGGGTQKFDLRSQKHYQCYYWRVFVKLIQGDEFVPSSDVAYYQLLVLYCNNYTCCKQHVIYNSGE